MVVLELGLWKCLDPSQYDNRKHRSTTHYLVDLVQFILTEAEKGHHTNFLAIDYSKAFDKVNINVALSKLLDLRVRPELLPWLTDFPVEQMAMCAPGADDLRLHRNYMWCSQGTKVGSVVFLTMVNHVASDSPFRWKYVDDITVEESRRNTAPGPPSSLPQTMTAIMYPGRYGSHDPQHQQVCSVAGQLWQKSTTTTTTGHYSWRLTSDHHHQFNPRLGVIMHESLKWDTRTEGIITKASTKKYFLVTLKLAGTTCKQLLKFYKTFILPGLEYGTAVWHSGITQKLSDNIERVQRASLYTSSTPRWAINVLWTKTGLWVLHARRESLCLNFARSWYTTTQPSTTGSRLRSKTCIVSLRNVTSVSVSKCKSQRTLNAPVFYVSRSLNKWTLLELERNSSLTTLSVAAV